MNSATRCDGCLGSRTCWVCLGQGRLERPHGRADMCSRCDGSGKCSLCQATKVIDLRPTQDRSRVHRVESDRSRTGPTELTR